MNTHVNPVILQALRPWIPVGDAYDLAAEAMHRIGKGEDRDRLVHVIRYPDGSIHGLSTSLHQDADLSGHIERYRSLAYFAGLE